MLVRGGPWLRPTLAEGWEDEVKAIAAMKSFMAMHAHAEANPGSNLRKRLQGLTFLRPSEAPQGRATARGACVIKRNSSGAPGNRSRKAQLERGVLKRPSAYFTRVHRGTDAMAARIKENAKRLR